MQVIYRFFPEILTDNDEVFISKITGVVESVDEFASMEISKFPESYNFRCIPSIPKYTNTIIQEITKLHNLFNFHLEIGKSIKSSSVIQFKLECHG